MVNEKLIVIFYTTFTKEILAISEWIGKDGYLYYSLVIQLGCHSATENNMTVSSPKAWLWGILLLLYEPLRLNQVEYT